MSMSRLKENNERRHSLRPKIINVGWESLRFGEEVNSRGEAMRDYSESKRSRTLWNMSSRTPMLKALAFHLESKSP